MNKFDYLIETCSERGHNYVKLPDHPTTEHGQPICPFCVYVGLMRAREEIKELRNQLEIARRDNLDQRK